MIIVKELAPDHFEASQPWNHLAFTGKTRDDAVSALLVAVNMSDFARYRIRAIRSASVVGFDQRVGKYVASCRATGLHGMGRTSSQAFDDLLKNLRAADLARVAAESSNEPVEEHGQV